MARSDTVCEPTALTRITSADGARSRKCSRNGRSRSPSLRTGTMIEIFILALAVSADCRCVPADDKLISFMLTPHPIPLWDYIGRPLLGGISLVLLLLQWQFPLARRHFSPLRVASRYVVFLDSW